MNVSTSTADQVITCALTSQYISDFERSIPHSVTVGLLALNLVFAIQAAIFNLLVIVAIVTTPKLQTPTFILLCNLAMTDFMISLVIGPFEIMYLVTRALGYYELFCTSWKILVILSYVLCPASLYTITSISIDRYLSLVSRSKYKTVVTKRKTVYVLVVIWIVSILGATFITALGKVPFLILVCCVTFLCLAVIADSYFMSFIAIHKRQLEIKSLKSELTMKRLTHLKTIPCNAGNDVGTSRDATGSDARAMYEEDKTKNVVNTVSDVVESRDHENGNVEFNDISRNNESQTNTSSLELRNLEITTSLENSFEKHKTSLEEDSLEISEGISGSDAVATQSACRKSVKSRLQNAGLLTDLEIFRKTLHTILIIVFLLFLCFLPYLVVSTLVTLRIINMGLAWDLACIIVYMNSSINPIILCTRIPHVRKACKRVLRKTFCKK